MTGPREVGVTPEQLVEQLKQAMPAGLRSIVLYGSAASGDHISGKSDYNVLIVAERLGMPELNALSKPVRSWVRAGNRAPLLFTAEQFTLSADSFPIEFSDMQQSRRVIFGEDVLARITVVPAHLRLQIEREIKAAVLQLRDRYLLTGGKPRAVAGLLVGSLSTFLVLMRAALRLYQDDVPARKLDAVRDLARHVGFAPDVFTTIHELKEGGRKLREISPLELFEIYLQTIQTVEGAVERRVRGK